MPSVIVTGADRGLGLSLCKEFLNRGWTVIAGKFLEDHELLERTQKKFPNLHIIRLDMGDPNSIAAAKEKVEKITKSLDMLASVAALMGRVNCSLFSDEGPMDLEAPWNSFRVNALGPLTLTQTLLPLLEKGSMKRLCYVSSEVGCIVLMKHRGGGSYPYPMSKASLNMGVRMMHNQLYPKGYTFRLFHPGWMKRQQPDGSLSDGALYDPDWTAGVASRFFETPLRDEHRCVMIDYNGYEWTF
ncbi:MAG: SDR family NAD(P)-dependent oxidoreductase [Treponema sp.]|nr:SDR family NAD(P)-dependent oxidoreductase [Treponema sp.]